MIPTPKTKVLLVSKDATLSGSPILLLHLLDALRDSPFSPFQLVVRNNRGGLIEEFRKKAKVLIQYDLDLSKLPKPNSLFRKIPRYFSRWERKIKIQDAINNSDIILLNTICLGEFLKDFHFIKNKKIISYIHELPITTELYFNRDEVLTQIDGSHYFFVPSDSVRNFLETSFGILPNKIFKLDYFIPYQATRFPPDLKTPKEKLVIGIIGTLEWRKGADLLPQILSTLFRKYGDLPIHFIWKGAGIESLFMRQVLMELKILDLLHKITFEKPEKDPFSLYSRMDLLLLISREDPYPLVVLEAARMKKPCICFEDAGGAPEFVGQDGGIVVPFLNVEAITAAIYQLYLNEPTRLKMGETAFEKYRNKHSQPEIIQTQFNALISIIH